VAYYEDYFAIEFSGLAPSLLFLCRVRRLSAYQLDRTAYRRRNVIEHVFGKLKNGGASLPDTIVSQKPTLPPSLSWPRIPQWVE
jgi:hypothetical protein